MYAFTSTHYIPSEGRAIVKTYDERFYELTALLTMKLAKITMDSSDPILDSVKMLGMIPGEDIIEVFVQ